MRSTAMNTGLTAPHGAARHGQPISSQRPRSPHPPTPLAGS